MGWWPWSGSEQDEAKAKWEAEPWGEYYGSFPGAYCIDNRKPPTEWSKAKLMAKTTAKQQDVAVQDQGQQGGGARRGTMSARSTTGMTIPHTSKRSPFLLVS